MLFWSTPHKRVYLIEEEKTWQVGWHHIKWCLWGVTTLAGTAPWMAVNWTVIRGVAPANFAIPSPQLHGDTTLALGTTLTGATPVMAVNWTLIREAAPANFAIPVPQIFCWPLGAPIFPCSSIDWTTVFCIGFGNNCVFPKFCNFRRHFLHFIDNFGNCFVCFLGI